MLAISKSLGPHACQRVCTPRSQSKQKICHELIGHVVVTFSVHGKRVCRQRGGAGSAKVAFLAHKLARILALFQVALHARSAWTDLTQVCIFSGYTACCVCRSKHERAVGTAFPLAAFVARHPWRDERQGDADALSLHRCSIQTLICSLLFTCPSQAVARRW